MLLVHVHDICTRKAMCIGYVSREKRQINMHVEY
jgi:hypothetical protein